MDDSALASAIFWLGWIEPIKFWAEVGVAITISVGVIAAFFAAPLSKRVENARELKILQLTNDATRLSVEADSARAAIAEANARASEANSRTAELQAESLKTQQAIMPRIAWASDRPEYLSLRKFAGVTAFIQAIPDWEARQFAQSIQLSLKNIGVDAELVDESRTNQKSDTIQEGVGIVSSRRISIIEIQKKYNQPLTSLREADNIPTELRGYAFGFALQKYFVQQGLNAFFSPGPYPLVPLAFDHPDEFVFIVVGAKPIPIEWLTRGLGPGSILSHGDMGGAPSAPIPLTPFRGNAPRGSTPKQ